MIKPIHLLYLTLTYKGSLRAVVESVRRSFMRNTSDGLGLIAVLSPTKMNCTGVKNAPRFPSIRPNGSSVLVLEFELNLLLTDIYNCYQFTNTKS